MEFQSPTSPEHLILSFRRWLTHHGGVIHPTVSISYSSSRGYCLISASSSSKPINEPIIAIPYHLAFSLITASINWCPALLRDTIGHRIEIFSRFALIHEYLLGQESKWWEYIAMLPQPSDMTNGGTPMWWADDSMEMKWIWGTNLEKARGERLSIWRAEYDNAISVLETAGWGWAEADGKASWNLYLWAATIFSSRCFGKRVLNRSSIDGADHANILPSNSTSQWFREEIWSEEFPVLCPGFDLANHDYRSKATWISGDKLLSLICHDPIKPCAEINNNYGATKGNEEILMGYGFTIFKNPNDLFSFSLPRGGSSLDGQSIHHISVTYASPPSILATPLLFPMILNMVANFRESPPIHKPPAHGSSPVILEPLNLQDPPTRVAAAGTSQLLLFLLDRYKSLVSAGSLEAPVYPVSKAELHAARYRRSQVRILYETNAFLLTHLISLQRQGYIASLQTILETPLGLGLLGESTLQQFRAAVYGNFRTRQPKKLKARGHGDAIWVLWICTMRLLYLRGELVEDNSVGSHMNSATSEQSRIEALTSSRSARWMSAIISQTYSRYIATDDEDLEPILHGDEVGSDGWQEAETYMSMVQVAVDKDPVSIYADNRWSIDILRWGWHVWREEGFILPARLVIDDEDEERGDAKERVDDVLFFGN